MHLFTAVTGAFAPRPSSTHRWEECRKPHRCPLHQTAYLRVAAAKRAATERRKTAAAVAQ